MKKISVLVLGMFAFVGIANAQMQEKTIVKETVTVAEPYSSVSQVLGMADDTPVVMTGNVLKSLGNEMYLFGDSTGTMTIEIDDDDWRGLSVSEYDTVRVRGQVDRGTPGVLVEVDYIEKI